MISEYSAGESREYCLRIDKNRDHRILLVPPLFDEANRLRRTLVLTMHALDALGADSLLPDLPGTNESLVPQADATPELWRSALADAGAAFGGVTVVASLRGGALVDDQASAKGWWRLAPAKGPQLLRAMLRTRIAGAREAGETLTTAELMEEGEQQGLYLAGNFLSSTMVTALNSLQPQPVTPLRTVGLEGETKPVDGHIAGSALWLRAEPDEDTVMAEAMAADILEWSRTCAAI